MALAADLLHLFGCPTTLEGDADEFSRQDSTIDSSDPRCAARGSDHLRREGSGHEVSADRAAAAAQGRAQRPDRADRRLRVRRHERLRRPGPDAERRAAGERRAEADSFSHDRALLSHAPGAAHRAESPFGEHGRHLRDRDLGARLHLGAAEEQGAARHDAQAQRLLDRAVRQVPRGAGLGDEPDGPVRPVAHRRRRLRVLLRLHRRRDQPVVSGHLRRHDADGTGQESGGGLPLHRGHDQQGDRVGAPAEGADARQAVLHLLRARRHPRPASRAEGVDRQVQGQVRRRLGQGARRDLCPPEEAGRDSRRMRS